MPSECRAVQPAGQITAAHAGTAFEVVANDGGELIFWHKLNAGSWESETLDIMTRHCGPEVHVFVIGSWIGPTALYAAALGASVTAVEADPQALGPLNRNIALNPALAGRISVVDKAISAMPGPVRFGSRRNGGDSMSSMVHDTMQTAWEVDTISPAELAALCPHGKSAFLKIDIEGGEYPVLPHAQALFALPLAGVHLSLHPQFMLGEAGGMARLARWIRTARATASVFAALGHLKIYRATSSGPRAATAVQLLARTGLCLWPLRGSWLFLPLKPPN